MHPGTNPTGTRLAFVMYRKARQNARNMLICDITTSVGVFGRVPIQLCSTGRYAARERVYVDLVLLSTDPTGPRLDIICSTISFRRQ